LKQNSRKVEEAMALLLEDEVTAMLLSWQAVFDQQGCLFLLFFDEP
jgi:hypothetical protein